MNNAVTIANRRPRRTCHVAAAAIWLSVLLAGDVSAARQQGTPDVPVPPPPSETFLRLTEAELIARLPAREKALVESAREPRDRFDKLLDVSDMRLAAISFELDRGAESVRDLLLIYDATMRIAERRLRAPETKAGPRDKLFKRLERRLAKQKVILTSVVEALRPDDSPTGLSVMNTLESIRIRALNSAMDADILVTPKEP